MGVYFLMRIKTMKWWNVAAALAVLAGGADAEILMMSHDF